MEEEENKGKTSETASRNEVLITHDSDLILISSNKFLFKVISKLKLIEKKNPSSYIECQFVYALTFKLFYEIMKPKLLETFSYKQINIHCSIHNPNISKCR